MILTTTNTPGGIVHMGVGGRRGLVSIQIVVSLCECGFYPVEKSGVMSVTVIHREQAVTQWICQCDHHSVKYCQIYSTFVLFYDTVQNFGGQ